MQDSEPTQNKPTRPPPQVWERPPGTRTEHCRSCHAPIWWHRHPTSGRTFQVTVETGHNHFIDCPDRRDWRVKR